MLSTYLITFLTIFHTTPGIMEPALTGLDYNDADIFLDVKFEKNGLNK